MKALADSFGVNLFRKGAIPIKGRVIRSRSKEFTILADNKEYVCVARGNLKLSDVKIVTGDIVEFDNGVITKIYERTTSISRPRVANVDSVNIVIAHEPEPDYLLIDKLIIQCRQAKIGVYITVNKCDLSNKTSEYVLANYKGAVDDIFIVSAITGEGIERLKNTLKNTLCSFAGQSAVGKTSIVNAIFDIDKRVNSLSDKTGRGRHTTTSREIHYCDDIMIVDTPGFSALDAQVASNELCNYYSDFEPYLGKCYFVGCAHVAEPDCLVKEAVLDGNISKERYNRYCQIYKEIIEYEKRRY